jgi:hypothetical protein
MNLMILIPLVLLFIAIVIIVSVQRSSTMAHLVPWLVGTGIAGALLVSMFVFLNSTVPIAPYETGSGAWTPLYWNLLLFAFAGFGLGVMLISLFALTFAYIKNRLKTR